MTDIASFIGSAVGSICAAIGACFAVLNWHNSRSVKLKITTRWEISSRWVYVDKKEVRDHFVLCNIGINNQGHRDVEISAIWYLTNTGWTSANYALWSAKIPKLIKAHCAEGFCLEFPMHFRGEKEKNFHKCEIFIVKTSCGKKFPVAAGKECVKKLRERDELNARKQRV